MGDGGSLPSPRARVLRGWSYPPRVGHTFLGFANTLSRSLKASRLIATVGVYCSRYPSRRQLHNTTIQQKVKKFFKKFVSTYFLHKMRWQIVGS